MIPPERLAEIKAVFEAWNPSVRRRVRPEGCVRKEAMRELLTAAEKAILAEGVLRKIAVAAWRDTGCWDPVVGYVDVTNVDFSGPEVAFLERLRSEVE